MKKFIAVVTSMAMVASLLTACGSNAASTETTTAAASEAASEKETAGEAERIQRPRQENRRGSFRTVPVIHPVLRFHIPVSDSVIPGIILY